MIAIFNYRPKADRPLTIKSRNSQKTIEFRECPGWEESGQAAFGNAGERRSACARQMCLQ